MSFLHVGRSFMKPAYNPFGEPGGFASGSFLGRIAEIRRREVQAAELCAALSQANGQGPQGPKMKKRPAFNWARHIYTLSPQEFRLRYRLSYSAFMELLEIIRPQLMAKDLAQARRSKGVPIAHAPFTTHATTGPTTSKAKLSALIFLINNCRFSCHG